MEVSPPEGRGRTLDLTFYERDVNCYRHGGHMNYRKRPVVIQAERYDGTTESVEKNKDAWSGTKNFNFFGSSGYFDFGRCAPC